MIDYMPSPEMAKQIYEYTVWHSIHTTRQVYQGVERIITETKERFAIGVEWAFGNKKLKDLLEQKAKMDELGARLPAIYKDGQRINLNRENCAD